MQVQAGSRFCLPSIIFYLLFIQDDSHSYDALSSDNQDILPANKFLSLRNL